MNDKLVKKKPVKVNPISKFLNQLRDEIPMDIQFPVKEYQFMNSRNWRFDWALVDLKIGIEYQGGMLMVKSGHSSIMGQSRDWEKFNEAQIRGWIVICVNPKTIDNGTAIEQLIRAIKVRTKQISYESEI